MRLLAEGLGFEPSHNGFRDRRATVTLALNIYGRDRGIRTLTGRILNPLSLPIGLYPHGRIGDRAPPLSLVRPIKLDNRQIFFPTRLTFIKDFVGS